MPIRTSVVLFIQWRVVSVTRTDCGTHARTHPPTYMGRLVGMGAGTTVLLRPRETCAPRSTRSSLPTSFAYRERTKVQRLVVESLHHQEPVRADASFVSGRAVCLGVGYTFGPHHEEAGRNSRSERALDSRPVERDEKSKDGERAQRRPNHCRPER
jgi:hypothetical protein